MKERIAREEASLKALLEGMDFVPKDLEPRCFNISESTNKDAKNSARGAASDMIFLARSQSAGRGRLGRSFSSGEGGLYMSLLFRKSMSPDYALRITVCAAVAVQRAVKKLTGLDGKIKWVNDIFAGNKKLAGILCEGACGENGEISHAVLGIGLNILKPEDPEISDIASSLFECAEKVPDRLALAAEITNEVYHALRRDFSSVTEEYREKSCLIGRRVRVIKPAEEYEAMVLGIGDAGELVIKREGADTEALTTGEVSVRL